MNCHYCSRSVESITAVYEDGHVFCDAICRAGYRKNAVKNDTASRLSLSPASTFKAQTGRTQELDIPIPLAGFEGRGLMLRTNFWLGSKLYLDGAAQKARKKWFTYTAKYQVQDNRGQPVEIVFKYLPLDTIPKVKVDGKEIELAPRLAWYEYVWIGSPALLMIFGGAIGGGVGMIAALMNSRWFRSERSTVMKYVLSGITTVASVVFWFVIALRFSAWVLPPIEESDLKREYEKANTGVRSSALTRQDLLTGRSWDLIQLTDGNGNLNPQGWSVVGNSKRYFKANGNFSQIYESGAMITGKWKPDSLWNNIEVSVGDYTATTEILVLTTDTLTVQSGGALIIHAARK